ncbi:hypothetical protein QN277_007232 [Acacia crassicarpa]|uniref:Uncharacterized protein n=1 Tax=Acacia crassicarpa TaxID=499986 RepID=A0AAE1IVK8_9FABA|nr:hypothetical protein QN277_007232 [Acacia crassicarpa]
MAKGPAPFSDIQEV